MAHRKKKMKLWNNKYCRCYLNQIEQDTFHIIEYKHQLLKRYYEEMFKIKFAKFDGNKLFLQLLLDCITT